MVPFFGPPGINAIAIIQQVKKWNRQRIIKCCYFRPITFYRDLFVRYSFAVYFLKYSSSTHARCSSLLPAQAPPLVRTVDGVRFCLLHAIINRYIKVQVGDCIRVFNHSRITEVQNRRSAGCDWMKRQATLCNISQLDGGLNSLNVVWHHVRHNNFVKPRSILYVCIYVRTFMFAQNLTTQTVTEAL